jgi:hypothetical protein
LRPPLVCIFLRKPCTRKRCRRLGCHVRFNLSSSQKFSDAHYTQDNGLYQNEPAGGNNDSGVYDTVSKVAVDVISNAVSGSPADGGLCHLGKISHWVLERDSSTPLRTFRFAPGIEDSARNDNSYAKEMPTGLCPRIFQTVLLAPPLSPRGARTATAGDIPCSGVRVSGKYLCPTAPAGHDTR